MKNIYGVFFLFISISLFAFIGCQSTENINSPDDSINKGGNKSAFSLSAINITPGATTCVELVAGQYNVIGSVCVEAFTDYLRITYNISVPYWSISETHLAVVNDPSQFPRTNNGNPKVGNFAYKGMHANVGTVSYDVPTAGLNSLVYIAAHAVADYCDPNLETKILCPQLPETDGLTPTWTPTGTDKIIKMEFATLGTYYGWCIDASRALHPSRGARDVKFFCSYDQTLSTCTTFIEKPENLDLINWIINHRDPSWGRNTVQAAIWQLMNPSGTGVNWQNPEGEDYFWNNATQREQIVSLAKQYGEGYEPDCGEKVLIIAYGPGVDPCDPIYQVVVFEKEVECVPGECSSETAWGFSYDKSLQDPYQGKSVLFGSQWARYFSYQR
jgi:hypothetical protein